jgi:NADH:ubiquinone oxidoreductase subunit D
VIGVDTGALTGFTYVFQQREAIYELYEEVCGARLTTNIGRIGGFERDFSPAFHAKTKRFLKEFPKFLMNLITRCYLVTAFSWIVQLVQVQFLRKSLRLFFCWTKFKSCRC